MLYRACNPAGAAGGHGPHYHPDTVEICFVARGRLDWWIGEQAHEIHPGDVLVAPVGVPHGAIDSTLQPSEYFVLHLAPEELSPALAKVLEGLGGVYPRQPEIGQWIRRALDEHRTRGELLGEVVGALVTLILSALARADSDAVKRRASRLVRKAQAALEDEGARVEDVAKELGVSSVWLNRLFQQELGESPGGWVRSRRLAEAKRLLALDRISVTEIAVRLGYTSSQYFATAFRHECGMTPSAYRALCAATWKARSGAAVCAPMR